MADRRTPQSARGSSTGSWRESRTQAILRAALEELAQVGYSALSIESIAQRVGIAKTTIYRRYPTKTELLRTAIRQFLTDALGEPRDTGSLRGDLIALGQQLLQLTSSVLGQSLFRTKLLDRVAPELEEIAREFESEHEALQLKIADRATRRGELVSVADFNRVVQVLFGFVLFKRVFRKQSVDELEIAGLVDMLLNGVIRTPARSRHGA